MYYWKLAEHVRYFKEDTEGVDKMTDVFEIVAQKAAKEAAQKVAQNMARDGMAFEKIAKYTKLSMEEITVLAEELQK